MTDLPSLQGTRPDPPQEDTRWDFPHLPPPPENVVGDSEPDGPFDNPSARTRVTTQSKLLDPSVSTCTTFDPLICVGSFDTHLTVDSSPSLEPVF